VPIDNTPDRARQPSIFFLKLDTMAGQACTVIVSGQRKQHKGLEMAACSSLLGFQEFMRGVPPGEVRDPHELAERLAACWDGLSGGAEESMGGGKLIGRMEDVTWAPPILSFSIERHGGTVLGSTRAEVHRWSVNVDQATAALGTVRRRQVYKMSRPVAVLPIAQEIAELILGGQDDPRLKWTEDRQRVRVYLSRALPPSRYKQTAQGRTRTLRRDLKELLKDTGRADAGVYGQAIFERVTPRPLVGPTVEAEPGDL
jgi:hypothetical protein